MIDAHCHYFTKPDEHAVFYNSVTSSDWERIPRQRNITPFYGIHPWYAKTGGRDALHLLDALVAEKAAAGEKFGIGETGLDRTNRNLDEEAQIAFFMHHLKLAEKYSLPVSVHCVHAWGLLAEILCDVSPGVPIIIHCFSGSLEVAEQLLCRNTYFSFAPCVRHIARQQRVLAALPLEKILLETDFGADFCGDVAAELKNLYRFAAELRGLSAEDLEGRIELTALHLSGVRSFALRTDF